MDKKFVIGIILGTIGLLVGTVFLAGRMANSAEVVVSKGAKVVAEETSFDWGDISIGGGVVEKEFLIKNEGSETLKLFNVSTSCMCTTAQFGDGSPLFGMHTKSGYVEEVGPGETTSLKVVFDPAFHGPDAIGPITRQIEIATNDPDKSLVNLTVTAMVIR